MKEVCKKFGAKKDKNSYIFKTKYGTLQVTDLNDNTFIPMMFENDFNLDKFLEDTYDNTINPYSFKWNLHSSDKKFNLERLEQRLTFLLRDNI